MLGIAVPSLTLVPVMMNRLVKSSRSSQQPIRTLVPLVWPLAPCLRRASALTLREAAFADAAQAA